MRQHIHEKDRPPEVATGLKTGLKTLAYLNLPGTQYLIRVAEVFMSASQPVIGKYRKQAVRSPLPVD